VRSSDLLLRFVAVAIAVGLFLVVRGERQVTVTFSVPIAPRLPPATSAAGPLPADVSVTVSGPWSRLRVIDGDDLGPAVVDLTRAGAGTVPWVVRPEALHVPHGVRVESIYPAQGTVELGRPDAARAGPAAGLPAGPP
jgi:hypothetical protein